MIYNNVYMCVVRVGRISLRGHLFLLLPVLAFRCRRCVSLRFSIVYTNAALCSLCNTEVCGQRKDAERVLSYTRTHDRDNGKSPCVLYFRRDSSRATAANMRYSGVRQAEDNNTHIFTVQIWNNEITSFKTRPSTAGNTRTYGFSTCMPTKNHSLKLPTWLRLCQVLDADARILAWLF